MVFPSISYNYNSPVAMGTNNTFTFTVNTNPGQQLGYLFVTFETWPSAAYSCKVGVQPLSSFSFLHDDQGNRMSSMNFNDGTASQHNSKCQLQGGGTNAVQTAPNVWTVNFNIQFLQPYGATVLVYVNGFDDSYVNNTGWPVLNSLSFTGVPTPTLSTVSVISAEGLSLQDKIQVFSVKLRDTAGGIAIYHGELLFLQGTGWRSGWDSSVGTRCRVGAEMTANMMWIESSTGAYAPDLPIGTGNAQPGPNCTLYPQYSSLVQTGENTMEVRFAISFPSHFTGVLQDHIYAADVLGQTPWDLIGGPHWNWYVWPSDWGSPPTLPSTFTDCIKVAYNSCPLAAATDAAHKDPSNIIPYWIESMINVAAPGVTIMPAAGAALQRDPSPLPPLSGFPGAGPLLRISTTATGFSMSNLTILGNRWGTNSPTDASVNFQTLGAYSTQLALNGAAIGSDVEVDGNGANLTNNNFYDAPGIGLLIQSPGSSSNDGSNITVTGGVVSNSNQTGILVYGSADLVAPCTTANAYTSLGVPTNIEINGVKLENSSGGPIVVHKGYMVRLIGNTINDHQLEPPLPSFESQGGGIVIGECVANVQITNNRIDDSNVGTPGAQGMELHGINMQVENNTVTNVPSDGIYLDATCGTSLYGGVMTNANTAQSGAPYSYNVVETGGISIVTQATTGRYTEEMKIWGLSSYNNIASLYFYEDGNQPKPFDHVMIENSCLDPNLHLSPSPPSGVMPSPLTSSCPQPPTQPTSSMPAQMICAAFK